MFKQGLKPKVKEDLMQTAAPTNNVFYHRAAYYYRTTYPNLLGKTNNLGLNNFFNTI
jgi:hypothetical protein